MRRDVWDFYLHLHFECSRSFSEQFHLLSMSLISHLFILISFFFQPNHVHAKYPPTHKQLFVPRQQLWLLPPISGCALRLCRREHFVIKFTRGFSPRVMRSNGCAASSLIATDKKRKEKKRPCAKWPGDDKRVLATHFISSPQSDAEGFRHIQAVDGFFSSLSLFVWDSHSATSSAIALMRPHKNGVTAVNLTLLWQLSILLFFFVFFSFFKRLRQSSRCVTRDEGMKRRAVMGNGFKHTSPAI